MHSIKYLPIRPLATWPHGKSKSCTGREQGSKERKIGAKRKCESIRTCQQSWPRRQRDPWQGRAGAVTKQRVSHSVLRRVTWGKVGKNWKESLSDPLSHPRQVIFRSTWLVQPDGGGPPEPGSFSLWHWAPGAAVLRAAPGLCLRGQQQPGQPAWEKQQTAVPKPQWFRQQEGKRQPLVLGTARLFADVLSWCQHMLWRRQRRVVKPHRGSPAAEGLWKPGQMQWENQGTTAQTSQQVVAQQGCGLLGFGEGAIQSFPALAGGRHGPPRCKADPV